MSGSALPSGIEPRPPGRLKGLPKEHGAKKKSQTCMSRVRPDKEHQRGDTRVYQPVGLRRSVRLTAPMSCGSMASKAGWRSPSNCHRLIPPEPPSLTTTRSVLDSPVNLICWGHRMGQDLN